MTGGGNMVVLAVVVGVVIVVYVVLLEIEVEKVVEFCCTPTTAMKFDRFDLVDILDGKKGDWLIRTSGRTKFRKMAIQHKIESVNQTVTITLRLLQFSIQQSRDSGCGEVGLKIRFVDYGLFESRFVVMFSRRIIM
jgi:hypothetical protein